MDELPAELLSYVIIHACSDPTASDYAAYSLILTSRRMKDAFDQHILTDITGISFSARVRKVSNALESMLQNGHAQLQTNHKEVQNLLRMCEAIFTEKPSDSMFEAVDMDPLLRKLRRASYDTRTVQNVAAHWYKTAMRDAVLLSTSTYQCRCLLVPYPPSLMTRFSGRLDQIQAARDEHARRNKPVHSSQRAAYIGDSLTSSLPAGQILSLGMLAIKSNLRATSCHRSANVQTLIIATEI